MMRLLLHTCCATCLLAALSGLKGKRCSVTSYFYNPNIHPLLEFRKRTKAMKTLGDQLKGEPEMIIREDYGLRAFLREATPAGEKNCARCYSLRLRETARFAAAEAFDAFSTTLLSSPRQNHGLIRDIAQEIAAEQGVKFLYADLRSELEAALHESKLRNLYRQQYCGCIFSEEERYRDTSAELYKGAERA